MSISTEVLDAYIKAQKKLIEFEDLDKNSCLVSLPLHYSAHTRIEIAITKISKDQYLLTDQGQTLTELKDSGHPTGSRLLDRVREIVRIWQVDLDGISLVRMCSHKDLGNVLHEVAEAAKTIGDAYLTPRDKETDPRVEETIKDRVRKTFQRERYFYREQQSVPGKIENAGHRIDFYIPANGSNGLALEVLVNPNKLQAEAWGFRARDMREANDRLLIGFIYDQVARDLSRTILGSIADIALSSNEADLFLTEQMSKYQISRGAA
jgi:Domain of unknown function DUF1828